MVIMLKRNISDAELEEVNEQMRSLRKKIKNLKRGATEEVRKFPVATVVAREHAEDKENGKYAYVRASKRPSDEPSLEEGHIAHGNEPSLEGGHIARYNELAAMSLH